MSMTSPNVSRATGARWALLLWGAQLLIVAPIVYYGVIRFIEGPPLGSVMLPVWLGSVAWLGLVVGVSITQRGRRWIVARRYQLLLTAVTTTLALLVIGEAAVRFVSDSDEDGNAFLRGHHLRPYRLPVKRIEAAARVYYGSSNTFMIEDPLLGWVPKPSARTAQYTYNAQGIRVTTGEIVYGEEPSPGTWRVALFGDSFTNGAEVSDAETWAEYTQAALRKRGRSIEVLNFGVNGYGMDQAFLRWRYTGARYKPALIVFGLQLENAKRNTNLIRPIYQRETELLPFAKPRFVLDGGALRLVNSPVVPLRELAETVRKIEAWPLAKYEGHYDPANFRAGVWSSSKLIGFASAVVRDTLASGTDDNVASTEERELAMQILEAFEAGVKSTGAEFIVLYLPKRHELRNMRTSGVVPDADFLRALERRFDFVSAASELLQQAERTSTAALYQDGGHYSPAGNRVVARVLAQRLEAAMESHVTQRR